MTFLNLKSFIFPFENSFKRKRVRKTLSVIITHFIFILIKNKI